MYECPIKLIIILFESFLYEVYFRSFQNVDLSDFIDYEK